MKTTKLISLLILLAIISFSCKEDDANNKEPEKKEITGASKYLFNEFSDYTYYEEITRKNNHPRDEEKIIEVGLFDIRYDKYSISFRDGGNLYFAGEGDIMFSRGEFLQIDSYESAEWVPLFDLSKETWTVYSHTILNDETKLTEIYELEGNYIKDTVITFKEKDYNCIELFYRYYEGRGEYINNKFKPYYYVNSRETVWFAEGLGFLRSDVFVGIVDPEYDNHHYYFKRDLIDYKQNEKNN